MSSDNLAAALQRAGLAPPSPADQQLITFGLGRLGGSEDDILEVTRAFWQTDTHGGDALVLLTRTTLVVALAPVMQGFLKKRASPPACVLIPFDDVRDLIEDDEQFDAPIIFFFGKGDTADFMLRFERSGERNRMRRPILEAHRGNFARWGLQLDPANYAEDFDRLYAELLASAGNDEGSVRDYVAAKYGESDFDFTNALGFAQEWRDCELRDAAGRTRSSSRVMRIASPQPWSDTHSSAKRVVLRLGERLYDDRLLGPPYDERTFDTGEPLSPSDAGPARLLALMTMAGFAHALRDPRAGEWIEAARAGIPHVPAAAIPGNVRELWKDIQALPQEGGPREIPIWEDADVHAITTKADGRVTYEIDMLTPTDRELVSGFLDTLVGVTGDQSPAVEDVVGACLLGVRTYDDLSPLSPIGWRKFVLYQTSELTHMLWDRFELAHETAMLAQWVNASIHAGGWGADGNSTPLGQHHSYSMNLAGRTGIGLFIIDSDTGMASAPTGDEARRAATAGHF